jgi:hypothetical protein
MNPQSDGYAARLGTPQDWGLTDAAFTPLRDELADHLHCLAREDGATSADEAASKLGSAKSRRALTASRIADQVYATLHRKPTREEWRELGWLLFWFVMILISDWMAHTYVALLGTTSEQRFHDERLITIQAFLAWAMQGLTRAGFFTLFALTLWHAWRIGAGVLIARILQLKLVHTVLVIAAFYAVGSYVVDYYRDYLGWIEQPPVIFTAPLISGAILTCGALIWIVSRGRFWSSGLMLVLLAGFLFPGGPLNYKVVDSASPIVWKKETVNGETVLSPETNPTKVLERKRRLEALPGWREQDGERYNFERNELTFRNTTFPLLWGNYFAQGEFEQLRQERKRLATQSTRYDRLEAYTRYHEFVTRSTTPASFGGAGLGWLAAPIPVLGVVGLLGLLLIMGRRSPGSLVVYSILTFVAIASTIMPFGLVQEPGKVVWFNIKGVMHSPFPGFDLLFIGGYLEQDWMLVLGLLLSAGVPWLLTAMFLKPGQRHVVPTGQEVAA